MRTDISVLALFFKRTLLVATCILACSMGVSIPVRADVDNCQCDTEILLSDDLPICIGDVNYIVDVYGCKLVGFAPDYLPPICNPPDLRQDQYTTVTRVCFVGVKPLPINAKATLDAILCAWNPCVSPGVMGAFVPQTPGSRYCWTTLFPKCVQVNNATGCISKCGDGCCILARQWTRMSDGSCMLTGSWACDLPSTSCINTCIEIECPTPVCCIER
jgi:hypothetical protein